MKFDVSIIILTKNGGNRLGKLLESLKNQKFQGNIEIIAIDSGSTDNSIEILEEYKVKLFQIDPEDFHHSRTRNLGAEKSNGNVLVYLTQDALPVDNCLLSNLLKPIDSENAGIVYGRQIANLDAKLMDYFFYLYFYPESRRVLNNRHAYNPKKFYIENIFASDVCAAIRKEIWEKIRFDDNVPMAEDKDFALRVLKEGYKIIYEPKATVYHSHDYNLSSLFERRFKDGAAFSSITLEGKGNFIGKGFRYFLEQIKFLFKNKCYSTIPYALIYNFVYFIAFFLGNNENYLPNIIKRSLLTN